MKRIYLDGNSLGPRMPGVAERLERLMRDEWDADLIGAWNRHGWWELPVTVGERIAPLLGAGPGQVVVADSTSIVIHKLLAAALSARPGRPWIVTHDANFPTDRHAIDAVADRYGAKVEAVGVEWLAEAVCDETAVLCVTHVDYRTGERLDIGALTRAAHEAGALALFDLSHSVGAMDLALDDDGVDLAAGCTYKYLNGGPGAPAFAYVARHLVPDLAHHLPGWVGHADPFSMREDHEPDPGMRRMLSGTPPVIALAALDAALDAFDGVDMRELRRRSVELGERFISGVDAELAGFGFELVTPREPERRGSHVSLRHEHAFEIVRAAASVGVIGDYREPGICRFGLAPLHTDLQDVDTAIERLAGVMDREEWRRPEFAIRSTVT